MLSFSASIPQATAAGDYTVCYYDYEIEQTVSLPVNIGLRGDANGDKKVNADLDRNGSITNVEITTVADIIMGK